MFDDPQSIIEALSWKPDTKVVNDFGEYVWLKRLFQDEKQIGITDCCFVEAPCRHHTEIQIRIDVASKN